MYDTDMVSVQYVFVCDCPNLDVLWRPSLILSTYVHPLCVTWYADLNPTCI